MARRFIFVNMPLKQLNSMTTIDSFRLLSGKEVTLQTAVQ